VQLPYESLSLPLAETGSQHIADGVLSVATECRFGSGIG